MRVAAPLDAVWARVLARPALRGSLAGHTGTAVLEEADDDAHVARFRLQGERATATVTAALRPAGEATDVDLRADVFGDASAAKLLAAIGEAAAPALAAPGEAAPVTPVPAPAAPHGLSAPAKGALAAAGAALALWALRGRR
jgi:hypothetical protein